MNEISIPCRCVVSMRPRHAYIFAPGECKVAVDTALLTIEGDDKQKGHVRVTLRVADVVETHVETRRGNLNGGGGGLGVIAIGFVFIITNLIYPLLFLPAGAVLMVVGVVIMVASMAKRVQLTFYGTQQFCDLVTITTRGVGGKVFDGFVDSFWAMARGGSTPP